MELEEIFAAPFTTPTTCFSCSPCAEKNRNVPFRFVTENHILGLVLVEGSYRTVTYTAVPRDKASVICVGMAQYPVPGSTATSSEQLQALTLIDPSCIDQPDETPLSLQHPTLTTSRGFPDTSIRDDASIVSNTHSISIQDGSRTSRPQSRRPSFNTGHTPTTSSSASASGPSASNYSTAYRTTADTATMRIPDLSQSIRTNTAHDPLILPTSGASALSPKARLIFQGPSDLVQDAIALLDFRPLAPCIAQWGNKGGGWSCGVFVGSADDSVLRFYEPKEGRLVLRSDLPKEHFQIDTPVMAIDFHSTGSFHILALAGQDGTVRIVTWTNGRHEPTFPNIASHTVIVDGPLVCLQIQQRTTSQFQIVIGSLCGYVCRIQCTVPSSSSSAPLSPLEWQGPTMVVQGLWNDLINDEDSVLAVHAFEDCIAIGTLAGRVFIYQASRHGDKYFKQWECILPYSIHGLQVQRSTVQSFDLLVVTRRSLHVFRPTTPVQIRHDTLKYSVAIAKAQLQSLLLQTLPLQPEPHPSPQAEPELPPSSPTSSVVKDPEDTLQEMVIAEYLPDDTAKAMESQNLVDDNVSSESSFLPLDPMAHVDDAYGDHGTEINEALVLLSQSNTETNMDEIVPQHNESEMQPEINSPPQSDLGDNDDAQWVMINSGDNSLDESQPKT